MRILSRTEQIVYLAWLAAIVAGCEEVQTARQTGTDQASPQSYTTHEQKRAQDAPNGD